MHVLDVDVAHNAPHPITQLLFNLKIIINR